MTRKALGRGLGALIPGAPPPHAVPQEPETDSASAPAPAPAAVSAPPPAAAAVASTTAPADTATATATVAAPAAATATAATEFASPGQMVREIPLNRIVPNPKQPRMEFSDEALAELAESIRVQGVLQPILVRQSGDHYQLIAGERRYRASQLVGLATIPAIVRPIEDERLLEVALIENLQREDLNAIEEAQGYQRLIDDMQYTHERLSHRLGKNRTTITNALRLLSLPASVQSMVSRGTLSAGHARPLLSLPSGPEIEACARYVVDMGLSVRKTEALIARKLRRKTGPRRPRGSAAAAQRPADAVSSSYGEWTDRLRRHFATQVRINTASDASGRGQIEIEFYNESDLERLLELLGVMS
jgi:ParB family chromosome partitioning protein